MKNIAVLFFMLFQVLAAQAQSARSTLHIHLSDGSPLMVTINDRNYKKINTLITIGDLPRKRHNLRVYKYRAYADGKGGKAELLYSGNFKITPGYTYDCIVDVRTRKLYIKQMTPGQAPGGYTPPPPAPRPDYRKDVPLTTEAQGLSQLQDAMNAVQEDSKKLELAKAYVTRHQISTSDLRAIASWVMFDDHKMDLLKAAYPSVQDKEAYAGLSDVFTLPEAQNDFKQYAQQQR